MILVSHREAPMVLCDSILQFSEGRVETIGAPAEPQASRGAAR
jgi:hypothetical protein